MFASYQAKTRQCESCGHSSSVHHDCVHCVKPICEHCEIYAEDAIDDHYCSAECHMAANEPEPVTSIYDEYDENDLWFALDADGQIISRRVA